MNNKCLFKTIHIFTSILIVLLAFSSIVCLDKYSISRGLSLITTFFVMIYGIFLYKKPHGNMLKYSMLLLALSMIFADHSYSGYTDIHFFESSSLLIASSIICYCSGRLDRYKKNRILFVVIFANLILNYILRIMSSPEIKGPFQYIAAASYLIVFTTLAFSYFSRYAEHREAGLIDKNNKSI